jgi:hypothetical protein
VVKKRLVGIGHPQATGWLLAIHQRQDPSQAGAWRRDVPIGKL